MPRGRVDVVVVVRGVGKRGRQFAELVKREVATALANIGAFEVTTVGDFAGNGNSCDPDRMKELSRAASLCCSLRVEEANDGG